MAMNRRQFLGALPVALTLPKVSWSEPTHMHMGLWWSLSQETREEWGRLLKKQWGVELNNALEFWFDGDQITGVTVLKVNSEGRHYLNKERKGFEKELLGVAL